MLLLVHELALYMIPAKLLDEPDEPDSTAIFEKITIEAGHRDH